MNEKQAHENLAKLLGIEPGIVPFLVEIFLDSTILNPVLPETVKKLGPLLDLKPGIKILDLACGKGGVSLPLVHIYKVKLTGVDMMPEYIREAWSRAEYSGLYHLCDFRIQDALEFAAQAQTQWDAIMSIGAMSFVWPGLEAGLEAVGKLVRPGGFIVVGEPYRRPETRDEAADQYPLKEELTELFSRFGQVIEILDDGIPGWEGYIAPQKKNMERLKEDYSDNSGVTDFLDTWAERNQWDMSNLGFAVWVIKTG